MEAGAAKALAVQIAARIKYLTTGVVGAALTINE
jgi:hypothetical protein